MKIILPIIFTILISIRSTSQTSIEIERLNDCIRDIIKYHQLDHKNDSVALHANKEKKWYNLLPSIGYDPITNRAGIHLNLSNYLQFLSRKKDTQYRNYQNFVKTNDAMNADTIAFKSSYRELEHLLRLYSNEEMLITQDSILYAIKVEENKNYRQPLKIS